MPERVADEARIHYLRPPDREELYIQRVVHRDDAVIVTLLEHTPLPRPLRVDGRTILEDGAPAVWFTFPGAWHDIGRFHRADGRFTGLYVNILEPVRFLAPLEWRAVDLFLDLWLDAGAGPAELTGAADGDAPARPRLLDEDELAQALARGWLDAATAARAHAEAARLAAEAHAGRWPPPVVAAWPLERARRAAAAG